MTDLVFEFTSTAPEMEKAASAALKRLQESALKTATILSGAGKSSAKDLRKMVDEMEGAAGGSVEALSNMASRMEQRANSFRKNATDLKNTALGQAKALRDAAKQLQDAAAQIGAVNLPRKGASAASIKAFTDQFTSAAKQFESAVADVGSATANYIKFDKQFEDRLKKKSTQANTAASQMAASNELISIQKAQGEALAQASKRQKEAIEADLAGFRNMERLRLQAQSSSQNALAKAQGEALAQASKRQKEAIEADLAGFRNMERLRLQAQNSSQNALTKAQGEALAQASKRQKEAIEADLAGFRDMERLRLQAQSSSQNALAKAQGEALAQASKRQKEAIEADLAGFRNMERLRLQAQSSSQNALAKAQGEALAQASKRQKEAIEADLAGFRNMERLRLQAQSSSQNALAKAQGEALAQASKRQKEAIEADLAGFRNMERLRLQAQSSSQNALAKAQGEALAQASKRQKEAIEADLAGFRNMERLRLQAQSSSQNALAKAQGEALAQASKRQKEAIEADLAGFRNMERLRLQAQNAAQAEQLRSREAHYRKMVAAATNTPAGDFQRYNASSGQAGRLVTVNGLANGPSAGELATSTRQARDRADELARSLRGVTVEANTLHSASRGLASGFNMLWLTWGEMLPLLAGAAISFGTAFSVKMGAQVDHTLQTIRVLSGETQEAIAGLNDQLLQLASTGPVGPLEVAEAMKTLSLAGMSAGDVSVAIRDVMNFAVAGTTDLKQAADVMTSVATAFNVTATGFNYVGDVIAKTAAVSKASVESVGEAFKTASVIHKQFGVSLEDAGVGIAALANLGIQGTAAGTALRNMYTDLSGRTPKVTKAMNELGLELRDQSGKFKDLVTLTMEFDKGLSRLDGTAQKNALLTILSERGGKPMIELRELVIEEEKVAREFAKRSGQAVVEGFEEGVKNRLQRMRDSIGDSAGFQIMARIELSETPLKQMETAVSALQSSLVSAFSSVKSEASGVALALQDLFRSDSFRSNIESLLQLTLNLAGGLVSLAKFANENAGVLATLTAAYIGLRLAVGHSLELMTFYTKAQTLATTHSWAATAAVTAERVAQGPLAVQKAIATSATQADTLATWANTGAKYAAITASKLFAAALPYVGVVLAVATGAWMLYESVVGSSTQAMEDAANSTASERRIKELEAETARLNENTDAMLANMTVEQLRASRAIKADNSDTSLLRAERDRYAKQASELMDIFEKTKGGGSQQAAVVLQAQITKAVNDTAKAETALTTALAAKDKASSKEQAALDANIAAAKKNAEVTKALQAARQSAAKTGTDKFLAEQQRQLGGTAAQNKLDNDLRYNHLDEIAKANKTELDGLRSHLNSQTEALKDFRDANLMAEGDYQNSLLTVMEAGNKLQREQIEAGTVKYANEIGRLMSGLAAMPKTEISDSDKANRFQELIAKLHTYLEQRNTDIAKMDEEAAKRERKLYVDQYKELDKLRKGNEEAVAASKDRVQAILDEGQAADRTQGLGGAELEAAQARIKVEMDGKKQLRQMDKAAAEQAQISITLRAHAAKTADEEVLKALLAGAEHYDEIVKALIEGRTALEVQLQTEAAVTVAAVYRKEFRQRVETMSNALSDGIVDALLTGGREGGDRLRAILEKQLVSEPFTLVVKALIQPFTTAVAGGVQSLVGSNPFGAASGSTALSALSGTSSLSTLFGGSGVLATASGAVSGFTSAMTAGVQSLVGLKGTTAQMVTSLTSAGHIAAPGAAAGASAGSALASVAAPAAAALVALNALGVFRKTKQVGTGLSGTIGASSDIDTYAKMRKSGTLFSGPKYWKDRTDSAELTNVMNQATGQIIGSTKAMADALGMDASRIASYTMKIDEAATEFKQGGMTAEQVQAKFAQILADQVTTYAEGVAGQVGGIQSIQRVGETAQEALARAYGWWNVEQQAQIAILNAQGKSQEALNRQRELDIALLGEDEKASRRRIFALEDQVTREAQLAGLTDRWNAASLTKAQLLEKEAEQYDPSNVGLLYAVATQEEGKELQQRLNEATMTRTELLALERAQILPGNQALFDSVQLAEERKSLDQRLNEATMTRTELLALERAQILPGNQALFDSVQLAEERKSLDQRLNEATMTRTELLALERAQILPGNQALFDSVQLAEERKSLDQRLNEATMTRTELLSLERAQILPGNQALFDKVNLEEEAKGLQQRLNEATMTRTELLALERAQILPGNQALFDSVQLAEEQKEVLSQVNTLTMSRVQLLDLERAKLLPANRALFDYAQSLGQVSEAKNLMVDALNDVVSSFSSLLESFTKFQSELATTHSLLSPQESYRESRKGLDKTYAAAVAGDKEALKALEGDASKFLEASKGYNASSSAYFADLATVKEMVAKAKDLTGSGLTDAEKQLAALGELNTSVKSLSSAMVAYTESISTAITVDLAAQLRQIDTDGNSAVSMREMVAKFSGLASESTLSKVFSLIDADGDGQITLLETISSNTGGTKAAIAGLGAVIAQLQAGTISSAAAASTIADLTKAPGTTSTGAPATSNTTTGVNTSSGSQNVHISSGGAVSVGDTIYGTSGNSISVPQAISNVNKAIASGDLYSIYHAAIADGISASSLDAMMGWSHGSSNTWAKSVGLPMFARGGFHAGGMRLVGENGPELEVTGASRIYSAKQTRDLLSNYSGQSDNSELVAEIRALRAEVVELKQHAAANVRVAQAVGKAQIETLEVIADASTDSAKSQRLMELAR